MTFCVLSFMQNECFKQRLMVKPEEQGDRGLNPQSTLLFLREPRGGSKAENCSTCVAAGALCWTEICSLIYFEAFWSSYPVLVDVFSCFLYWQYVLSVLFSLDFYSSFKTFKYLSLVLFNCCLFTCVLIRLWFHLYYCICDIDLQMCVFLFLLLVWELLGWQRWDLQSVYLLPSQGQVIGYVIPNMHC